jgi:hypothetical protein
MNQVPGSNLLLQVAARCVPDPDDQNHIALGVLTLLGNTDVALDKIPLFCPLPTLKETSGGSAVRISIYWSL